MTILAISTIFAGSMTRPVSAKPDILPTSALSRGMKGVGRTVFHGTKIDSFDVEILAVLKNYLGAKSDVILARLSGGPIDRTEGILGMSGSPVYVDGKLIGAVSVGWAFSKEAIMGITPIEEMLEILDRPDTISDARLNSGIGFASPRAQSPTDIGAPRRAVTPVFASGFPSAVIDELRGELAPFGLVPVQGAGGTDVDLPEAALEPGASIGVQFVRGDLSLTSIGTLTYIDGDRLVAFGHPMMFMGTTSMPMTSAYIHDVMPSQYFSWKFGSAVRQIGAVVQDRAPGVGGVIGRGVDMMPVSIVVRSQARSESYSVEVVRDRNFGPMFTRATVFSALLSSEQAMGDVTVKTRSRIALTGYEPLVMSNIYAGPMGLGEGVGGVTRPLELLMGNSYEEVRVEDASFELDVVETIQAAKIDGLRLDRSRFEAGDVVGLHVTVRPYLGEPQVIKTSITLPAFVEDQQLTLRVASAKDHNSADAKRVPAEYRPKNVTHLLRKLAELPRNDQLVIELSAPRRGATVEGREMATLPPSVLAALQMRRESGSIASVSRSVLVQDRLTTDFVLTGSQTVLLQVGDEQGLRFGGPQRRSPQPSNEKEGR